MRGRYIFLLLPICLFCFGSGASTGANERQNEKQAGRENRPNIIIINADDIGYGDVGAYGARLVKTPHIDKLAEQGRLFTDFHSASAVCSPSRYALVTGEYPARRNLWQPIFSKSPLVVDTKQITIAKVMRAAGYATAVIGKWHLGFGDGKEADWNKALKPGPLELGFDYYFGVPVLNSHPPFVYVENHQVLGLNANDPLAYGKAAKTREFDEKFTFDTYQNRPQEYLGGADSAHALYKDREVGSVLKDKAVDWIKRNKSKPFFLLLSTTNIHHPFTPAPQFVGTSKAGSYGDSIHELDWMVGEVMQALQNEGLEKNTIVFFTSDNGGMLNRGGQTAWEAGHRLNGDLLGFKFDAWEGGHRVPFIVRWPGKIPANSSSDQLASNVDFLATLAAIAGQPLTAKELHDSVNVLPALTGTPGQALRAHLLISPSKNTHLSLRKGKWMYIPAQDGGGFSDTEVGQHRLGGAAAQKFTGQINSDVENGRVKNGAAPAQLYDLSADPRERTNIYNQNPEIVAEMKQLMDHILKEPERAN